MSHWIDIDGQPHGIGKRTAAQYAVAIRRLVEAGAGRFDIRTAQTIEATLDQTDHYRKGLEASQSMTPATRDFCRDLLRSKETRRTFLRMHLELRSHAQAILDRTCSEHRRLTPNEMMEVRKFGTMAAAIAIETTGAPLRLDNLRKLKHRGTDRTLFFPQGEQSEAVIMLPKSAMKGVKGEKKELPPIPIMEDKRQGLQTLRWYLDEIRPLFENHEESEFLFPAVRSAGPICQQLFHKWILDATTRAGLTMRTHRFRHALATLLMKRDPSMVRSVAALLGNEPETVMRNYAWLDKEKMIETVQQQIALMYDEDAV